MDLRHSLIPDDLIEDLLHSMPKHTGPDLEVDRHLPKYDYIGFMAKMAGADDGETGSGRKGVGATAGVGNSAGVGFLNGAAASPSKQQPRLHVMASPKRDDLRSPPVNGNGSGSVGGSPVKAA